MNIENHFDPWCDCHEDFEVTCKYCGTEGLEWVLLSQGWRLADADGRTAWTLFNAVTEAIKPSNAERAHILGAWNRTVPLTEYLDQGVGLTLH